MAVTYIVTIWLMLISIMDIRNRRVPVWMLVPGGMLTAVALILPDCVDLKYPGAIIGAVPGFLLLGVALVTQKAGYGDGIVMLFLGILSEGKSLLLFGLSLFLIAVFSMALLVFHKVGRNTKIPYLPFLTGAWFMMILFWEG